MNVSSRIAGLGHYVPERCVPNAEIEARLNLKPGWIEKRTGIRERRYAQDHQSLTDIALSAAQMAIENSKLDKDDISTLLLATSTPDHLLPPSAPLLAHKLGLSNGAGVDLAGACCGFLYALVIADSLVRTQNKPVLIVAANILSRRINPTERASAVLFADAAAAVVLAPSNSGGSGILAASLETDGSDYDLIKINAGGSDNPFSENTPIAQTRMMLSDGPKVFSRAIEMMTQTSRNVISQADIEVDEITRFIPHQANIRIIERVRCNLAIERKVMLSSLENFGNSSAATIPLTLSIDHQNSPLGHGETVLMSAVGAGFMSGSVIFKI